MTLSTANFVFADIIYHIFAHLDPERYSPYDPHANLYDARQALARSARACRSFTRPALKVLWKRIPDDQPLADLLCSLGIAEKESTLAGNDVIGDEPARFEIPIERGNSSAPWGEAQAIERRWKKLRGYDDPYILRNGQEDPRAHPRWERFREYVSYVRAITLFAFDGPKWCELWTEMLPLLDGAPLLPSLESVSFCNISKRALTPSAFLLIAPSVSKLDFTFNVYPDTQSLIYSAFVLAFDHAPTIEKLRLLEQPWKDMHTRCPRVRHLEVIYQVNPTGLNYIAEFPALQNLSVSLHNIFSIGDDVSFPQLRVLKAGGIWAELDFFLRSIRCPELRELSLEAWQSGASAHQMAEDASQCLQAVASYHPSLKGLSVRTTFGPPPPAGTCVARMIPTVQDTFQGSILGVIRPLLTLRRLRKLSLSLPDYFDVECADTDVLLMSESWRNIEELHIDIWSYLAPRGMSLGDRARGGDFASTAHFARNCPYLRSLHLPPMEITAETLDAVEFSGKAHGLQTLIVPKFKVRPDSDDSTKLVEEAVGRTFPSAAWAFWVDRTVAIDGWVVAGDAAHCLDCVGTVGQDSAGAL
ncbi:hypothetical protein BD309DRAFT_967292 [Dichomitus squalens]|nr:hypothetical protein BD309DRAFT_967292 [Dichomitus squalens]